MSVIKTRDLVADVNMCSCVVGVEVATAAYTARYGHCLHSQPHRPHYL